MILGVLTLNRRWRDFDDFDGGVLELETKTEDECVEGRFGSRVCGEAGCGDYGDVGAGTNTDIVRCLIMGEEEFDYFWNLLDQTRWCVSLLLEERQELHAQVDYAVEVDCKLGVKGLGIEFGWIC